MNGIDLCRYVFERHPQTFKLLLTGYSDFEYAKQAIAYNVKEYLLKPVDPKEVECLLRQYAKELFGMESRNRETQQMRRLIERDRRRYTENLLIELARSADACWTEESNPLAEELGLVLEKGFVCICLRWNRNASHVFVRIATRN